MVSHCGLVDKGRETGPVERETIRCGDCFAVALARELEGAVVTGDLEFGSVAALVDVEWLPQAKTYG